MNRKELVEKLKKAGSIILIGAGCALAGCDSEIPSYKVVDCNNTNEIHSYPFSQYRRSGAIELILPELGEGDQLNLRVDGRSILIIENDDRHFIFVDEPLSGDRVFPYYGEEISIDGRNESLTLKFDERFFNNEEVRVLRVEGECK